MNDINAKTINFTDQNWDTLYNVVDNRDFPEREAEMIYAALTEKMRYIPFCDYLKRFLYKNAGLSGPFDEIPLTEYQSILKAAFRENNAPASHPGGVSLPCGIKPALYNIFPGGTSFCGVICKLQNAGESDME